jgi:hypothetical protein
MILAVCGTASGREETPLLVRIGLTAHDDAYQLAEAGVPIVEARGTWALARLSATQLSRARELGFPVTVLERIEPGQHYFLVRTLTDEARQAVQATGRVLLIEGRDMLLRTGDEVPRLPTGDIMLKRVREHPISGPRFFAPPLPTAAADPLIEWLISQVREDSVRSYIQRLENFRTRYSSEDSCQAAAEYIYAFFRDRGLDSVYYHDYSTRYAPNVVATIPGIVNPRRIYIIDGHFDSTAYPYSNAPGADDNASGTACVMEAARVLAGMRFRYTLKFIAFAGEEQGLVGSTDYARDAAAAGDSILGVLNFDMVAYLDDSRWDLDLVYNSASADLADFTYASAQTYVPQLLPIKEYDPTAYNSDHASFWDEGFDAICGIEHAGTRWNPYYHSSQDRIGTLTLPFATAVAKCGVATLAGLGIPDTTEYVSITLDPDTTVVHPGGTLGFTRILTNNSGQTRTVQAWSEVTLPGGRPYPHNPVLGPTTFTLTPHQTISNHFTQNVPRNARPGNYTYCGLVGTYPAEMDVNCFDLTVIP